MPRIVTPREDRLADALEGIRDWASYYPESVFPEPDWREAHRLLSAGGMSVDAITASIMRRAIARVAQIAHEALAEPDEPKH
jgi:hypothetical protein